MQWIGFPISEKLIVKEEALYINIITGAHDGIIIQVGLSSHRYIGIDRKFNGLVILTTFGGNNNYPIGGIGPQIEAAAASFNMVILSISLGLILFTSPVYGK